MSAPYQPNPPKLDDHALLEEYEHLAGYGMSDRKIAKRLGYTDTQHMLKLLQQARERAAGRAALATSPPQLTHATQRALSTKDYR